MKRIYVVALILLALVLLTGCGEQLKSGVVADKLFTPAHTDTYTTLTKIGKVFMPMVHTVFKPDNYQILVQGENSKEESMQQWWTVTAESYNSVSIGSQVER